MKNVIKSRTGSYFNASLSEIFKFDQKISKLKYRTVPAEEILKKILSERMDIPDRADEENALQRQERFMSDTGYSSYSHTGMIELRFSRKGSSWIIIKDENDNVVWIREFYRNIASSLLQRLSVFMHFAKNVATYRPEGMNLVRISETDYEWRGENVDSKDFNPFDYLMGMSDEEKRIFKENHDDHVRYMKRSKGKVRREWEFRSGWEKK
jgi:hypothetical protein